MVEKWYCEKSSAARWNFYKAKLRQHTLNRTSAESNLSALKGLAASAGLWYHDGFDTTGMTGLELIVVGMDSA